MNSDDMQNRSKEVRDILRGLDWREHYRIQSISIWPDCIQIILKDSDKYL